MPDRNIMQVCLKKWHKLKLFNGTMKTNPPFCTKAPKILSKGNTIKKKTNKLEHKLCLITSIAMDNLLGCCD